MSPVPVELLSLVLDFVAADDPHREQLKECSLVNRTFCSLSQSILFRSLLLDDCWLEEEDDDQAELDIQVFHRLLASSPHIRKYVRQLSFGFRSMNAPELCPVLAALPNVHSLTVDGYDEAFRVSFARGIHFRNSMAMIQTHLLPKLRHFKLAFFWDLLDLKLHTCRQLRTLEITETDLSTSAFTTSTSSEVHPLESLIYGIPTVSFLGCEAPLVNFLRAANCQPSFLKISSPNHYREESEIIAACRVMNSCSSSLLHLEVCDLVFDDATRTTWHDHFHLSRFPKLEQLVFHFGQPSCNSKTTAQLSSLISLLSGDEEGLPIRRIFVSLSIPPDWDAGSEKLWKQLDWALRKKRLPHLQYFCFIIREVRGKLHSTPKHGRSRWIEAAMSQEWSRGLVRFGRLPAL